MRSSHLLASAFVVGSCALTGSVRANLFATEWANSGVASLYNINTDTRVVTRVGAVGAMGANGRFIGLVVNTDGTIYTVSEEGNSRLFRVNETTGVTTPIGALGFNLQEGDMTINPANGTLYVANGSGDNLYTVNTTTGAATLVGPFGASGRDVSGMQFFNGLLYGVALNDSNPDTLVTINPATGLATNIGPTGTNFGVIAGMGRDPVNNTIFIAGPSSQFGNNNQLWRLNLATGAATLDGALVGLDASLSGFSSAGDPPNLPEPTAAGAFVLGMMLIAGARRRNG